MMMMTIHTIMYTNQYSRIKLPFCQTYVVMYAHLDLCIMGQKEKVMHHMVMVIGNGTAEPEYVEPKTNDDTSSLLWTLTVDMRKQEQFLQLLTHQVVLKQHSD